MQWETQFHSFARQGVDRHCALVTCETVQVAPLSQFPPILSAFNIHAPPGRLSAASATARQC